MTSSNGNIFRVTGHYAGNSPHRSPGNSPHKGQWRGALMFSLIMLICVWINDWVNNREAGDLRRHHAHYDVTVMDTIESAWWLQMSWCQAICNYHIRTQADQRDIKIVAMEYMRERSQSPVWYLTYQGRMTHICDSNLTIIESDNGLSPDRHQAITWTNFGILLTGPLGTNFSEILTENHTFSFKKMHVKISSGKWRPFSPGLVVSPHTLSTRELKQSVLSLLYIMQRATVIVIFYAKRNRKQTGY